MDPRAPELQQYLQYKFPNMQHLIQIATGIIDRVHTDKRLCLVGSFNTFKTTVLRIIRDMCEFYNLPTIPVTTLNVHASSIRFNTVHSEFGIDWRTSQPSKFNKILNSGPLYILIDDCLTLDPDLFSNLSTFLSERRSCPCPWGGCYVICTAPIVPILPFMEMRYVPKYLPHYSSIKDVQWLASFKEISFDDLATNGDICNNIMMKGVLQFGATFPEYILRRSAFNEAGSHNFGRTYAHLSKGTILTWNPQRADYYNALCHKSWAEISEEHELPLWRSKKRQSTTDDSRPPAANKQWERISATDIDTHSTNGKLAVVHNRICSGEQIIVVHKTRGLQKGTIGIYVHPHQIRVRDRIVPLDVVRFPTNSTEYLYKGYPIALCSAITISRVLGERFDQVQIDLCQRVSLYELVLASTRVLSSNNISLITNDTKCLQ